MPTLDIDLPVLGNPIIDWLIAVAITLAITLTASMLKRIGLRYLPRWAARTKSGVDDALVAILSALRLPLVFFVALLTGSGALTLKPRVDHSLIIIATIAVFLQVGLWLAAALQFWLAHYRERAMASDAGAATSLAAIGFIGQIVLWTMVVLLALNNVGVDVTAMVAGLGVGGIAVALAVQNILSDLFASLSIVIDKPFVIGDFIIVEDLRGTVQHVGLKTTRVRSLDGEQLIFSNSDLLKARVRNYKQMQERRILFKFGVIYDTDDRLLEAIPATVRRIVDAQTDARFDRAHFAGFGDSSLDFEVVYIMQFADYSRYMDTQQAINLALLRDFRAKGIEFAFPTRTLLVDKIAPLLMAERDEKPKPPRLAASARA